LEEKRELKRIFILTLLLAVFSLAVVFYYTGGEFYSSNLFSPATPEDTISLILFIEFIIVLLLPFILLAIYLIFGREKNVVVLEYLSTIPNKNRTPYEVNLLFKDSAFVSDHDAFYATLLDLHRKEKISITGKGNDRDVLIKLIDAHGDSDYEQRVLDFLSSTRNVMGRGVVDTEYLDRLIKKVY